MTSSLGLFRPSEAALSASRTTVASLFRARVEQQPDAVAVEFEGVSLSYGGLLERVNNLAWVLCSRGIGRGDRIGVLSRNRPEYLEIELAAATLGAAAACLNCRLGGPELAHSVALVAPKIVIAEDGLDARLDGLDLPPHERLLLGEPYEQLLRVDSGGEPPLAAEPEDGLVILYTSGTTGFPKAAVVSHRAMIARALVFTAELGIAPADGFIAWPPFYHMASTDQALATLLWGGRVIVVDGYRPEPIIDALERHSIGWCVLIPGMIEPFITALKARSPLIRGVRVCGAMADLVPPQQIADVTRLLGAPYLNSFGATETGLPPGTRALIPAGERPGALSKRQSAFCEVKLVGPSDDRVEPAEPGELAIRGPTLFSGYWNADETNAHDFRGGWFHMGDVFRRNADGTLDFVDRAKYMIKTGGENVYPAEIERVLLAEPRVLDAAVVRAPDARWGETPVAFVARRDESLEAEHLLASCRRELAGYKQPSRIVFIAFDAFPRSTSGKIQRHELERRLALAREANA